MLRVWLPLNKDLKNNGLLNTTVTNSNATISTTDKAYYFNGSSSFISISDVGPFFVGGANPFSVSFWFYHSGNARRGVIFGNYGIASTSEAFNIEITADNRIRFWWKGSPNWIPTATTYTIVTKTWYHITYTYDGSRVYLYVNGELKESLSVTLSKITSNSLWYIGRDSRTGTTAFNGYVQDFRIYDHVLSTKEIRDIYKHLVLHYTLSDPYIENTTNLFNSISSVNTRMERYGNGIKVLTTTGDAYAGISLKSSLLKDHTYRISFDVDMAEGDVCWFGLFYGGQKHNTQIHNGRTVMNVVPTQDLASLTFDDSSRVNSSPIYITNFLIEEKDHATPYVAGSRTSTTMYDSSGFNNDATITGNLAVYSDSNRYSNSTLFSNSYLLLDDVIPSDIAQFTISVWLKPTTTATGCVWNGRTVVGQAFAVFYLGSGIRFDDSSYQLAAANTVILNQWNHVVCTYKTGGQKKIYVNGILKSQGTAGTGTKSSTIATIGRSSDHDTVTASNQYTGYMSDFRIYLSEFSEDDVLNLYKDSFIIDKNQHAYTYEIDENNYNIQPQVLKNGTFVTKQLRESASDSSVVECDTKIYKNGNLSTNEIYEI